MRMEANRTRLSYHKGFALGFALLALMAVGDARAQENFPSRPVQIIVPFGPEGGADQLAHTISPLLEAHLKAPFPVIDVPGRTGDTGMEKLLVDPPDGYTMAVL